MLNLKLLIFEVRSSTEFPEKTKLEILSVWIMLKVMTGGAYTSATECAVGN